MTNPDKASVNTNEELDSLISAFTSPVPDHILTDYGGRKKKKNGGEE